MKHRPPSSRSSDHDWVPFDTITVVEREKVQKPVLYDATGKPLVHAPRPVGFQKK